MAEEGLLPADFDVGLKGFIEGRAILADDTLSWGSGGLGKTMYGGAARGGDGLLARAAGALQIEPKFGFDLTGRVLLTANSEHRTGVDIVEAFLQYKPAPTSAFSFSAKAGAFLPPISLENTGLAWTSPYTITSSAINSWVGEELKTIGGEATVLHHSDDLEIALTGAIFTANDPAGTLLAWRGWSMNDRVTGLFDRLRLPPIPIIQPNSPLVGQISTEEPFREIDNRVGTYASLTLNHTDYGKLVVMRYVNNADDRTFNHGQYAWRTSFWSVGYATILPAEVDLIAQYMKGVTSVFTLPAPFDPLDETYFKAAFVLVSKAWDQHRVSFRVDRFDNFSDDLNLDNTNEHGTAFTAAYTFRPAPNQRLTVEILHVDSSRPERAVLGLPIAAHETQVQASYRFFFDAAP